MKINKQGNYYTFEDGISKTNKLSYISLVKKQSKYDVSKLEIISKMLKHTTKNLSRHVFALECAENYDLSFNRIAVDMFNYIIIEHNVVYISGEYVADYDFANIESLLKDYLENDNLVQSDFKQVVQSLKVELDVLKNDYTKLARRMSRDTVYQDNDLYLSLADYEAFLKSVNLVDLQVFMQELMIEMQYVLHKTNTGEKANLSLKSSEFNVERYLVNQEKELDVVYDYQIDQAKVNVIYYLTKEFSREKVSIFNLVFGGDAFSKLFMNVREAHSICYTINSQVVNRDIVQVQTGVNHENVELVIKLIDEQLEAIKNGEITELANAKDKMISLYQSIENDYTSRKNLVEREILYKEENDIATIINNVEAVTIEDVMEVANSLAKIKQIVVK